jgi:uncharacterized protein (TIGR02145 family)
MNKFLALFFVIPFSVLAQMKTYPKASKAQVGEQTKTGMQVKKSPLNQTESKSTAIPNPTQKKVQQQYNTITDIDGNIYKTVKIGEQVWMSENLKTTHFKNGKEIELIDGTVNWEQTKASGWCYYQNDEYNNKVYGKLYNYYAAIDDNGLCPAGWHLPSNGEWRELIDYLGGRDIGGGKMKSTIHWLSPNKEASNSSGFSGFPGGCRNISGQYILITGHGTWWSATDYNENQAWNFSLDYTNGLISDYHSMRKMGFSVRCLKD